MKKGFGKESGMPAAIKVPNKPKAQGTAGLSNKKTSTHQELQKHVHSSAGHLDSKMEGQKADPGYHAHFSGQGK